MARIAIFCDGTWNSPRQAQPTHVYRLFKATLPSADQHPVYIPGVGTGDKWASRFGRLLNKIGGGAFGWGLNDSIKEAYRALAMWYQPGDSIMIFGFSRGAYTARSLAGMIRKVGIIENPTKARIEEAFALYRMRGPQNAPDEPHIMAARQKLSPQFATSCKDMAWRAENRAALAKENTVHLVEIDYLGVWDTVGALGIPTSILGPIALLWNRQYRFHDTNLSSSVKAARHALALDERRVFYRPAFWDNLEQHRDGPGLNQGDRSETRPYQQLWFVGTHGVVGGSGATRALTSITLDWMVQGAKGLELCKDVTLLDAPADALVDSDELREVPLVYRLAGALLDWRKGPGHRIDLHQSARDRIAGRDDYRPRSLVRSKL